MEQVGPTPAPAAAGAYCAVHIGPAFAQRIPRLKKFEIHCSQEQKVKGERERESLPRKQAKTN